jgi:CRP-like cAMP-binding protein
VLAAGRDALLRAAASNALLSNSLFSAAASAVLVAEENAEIRCVGTVTEKIAQFLLEMEVRLSSKRGEIDLPMRRHHIADFFGLTLETVSRTFSALQNKKIIQFRDQRQRRVVICDKPRLQELASDASIFENSRVLKSRKAMNTPHHQRAMPA